VRIMEDGKAIQALIDQGILSPAEMASAFGGSPELKVVHPETHDGLFQARQVDRRDLLRNSDFLKLKAEGKGGAAWFQGIYFWLKQYPQWETYLEGRKKVQQDRRYHDFPIVLTADCKLLRGRGVFVMDISGVDSFLKGLAQELSASKKLLHLDLLQTGVTEDKAKELVGFLRGYTGLQPLDLKKVCEEAILPRIITGSTPSSTEDLVKYTRYCEEILWFSLPDATELWVVTKDGSIRAARETLFPAAYHPSPNWESNQKYVPGLNFVSDEYIQGADPTRIGRWRTFFKKGGVKLEPDNGVEEFALNFAEEYLRTISRTVTRVDNRNHGYDVEADSIASGLMRVEVKGKGNENPVELTENESATAAKYGDDYFLYVVCPIPENPCLYGIQNPIQIGKREKLSVFPEDWKSWKII